MSKCIAIVGAGFSGTVLAANLLRLDAPNAAGAPTDVVLIERGPSMGPGVAYTPRDWPYLLNVPAGRLSADSKDPLQFLRFARETLPAAGAEDFLPRSLYGRYLERILLESERAASAQMRLVRLSAECTQISRSHADGTLKLDLNGHHSVSADRVVLAVGNAPPASLPWARDCAAHPAYRGDPWTLPRSLGAEHSVVIVGSGLTMADVALSLCDGAGRPPRLMCISRRGLKPLAQSTFRPTAPENAAITLMQAESARALLAASRRLVEESASRGGDWREVVTLLRSLAPQIWQRFSDIDRKRFLRHAQCYWDIHRHRLPPVMAERLEALQRDGELEVNAGRILDIRPSGEQLRVTWRPRGNAEPRSMTVDLVVNATGPDHSLKQSREPLLRSMQAAGLIAADALGLGLLTDEQSACIGANGTTDSRLFYLGPMLRARYWEATAATELRDHAERLARHLLAV